MTSGAMRSISRHIMLSTLSRGSSFSSAPMTLSCRTSCSFDWVMSVRTITTFSSNPCASNTGVDETCTQSR
ncbi:hypothetical protein D3C76_1303900 [compost metagenome]